MGYVMQIEVLKIFVKITLTVKRAKVVKLKEQNV